MEKSVVYKALESYQLYLQLGATPFEQSKLDAVVKCKEYLENGGKEDDDWLFSTIEISNAVTYYHKQLDATLREAKITNDAALIADLRVEQRIISKLNTRFDEFYSQFT